MEAIPPSNEVDNMEEDVDDEASSDGDSVDSEFQAEEEKEKELLPLIQFLPLPNPVPVPVDDPAPAPVPVLPKGTKRKASREKGKLLWEIWEQEDQKLVDEHKTEDGDLDHLNNVITVTAEPPPDLIMPLLRYQKEFLAWAIKQEQSVVAGGILADEMGMGKTIQAISLVLARREAARALFREAVGCTLVICPLAALSHWSDEIERYTSPGSTKVLVYHGPKRDKNAEEFKKYDFVLTTYPTVESEYRGCIVSLKEQCEYCNKWFYPAKLVNHKSYYCGPSAVETSKQSKQKKKKIPDAGKKSILHSIKWNRIILDEAHIIKERHRNTAKAVFALKAFYRWALSGTPLQSNVGDLYSLIRFLQIRPYSYYFCKDCDCRILDYTSHVSCSNCTHNAVRHFCWWNKNVAKIYGNVEREKRAMILLKHRVLKDIFLRRTKLGRTADLSLPPRVITLRRDALDIKESDYYESLYKDIKAQFNTYVEAGTLMKNYTNVFVLLIRLRQAADHPYLVVYSQSRGADANLNDEHKMEHECGLCHQPAEDNVVTSCGHEFCKACLIDFSASLGSFSCPTCLELPTMDWTTDADTEQQAESKTTPKGFRASSILNLIKLDDFQTSTKIEALREEIRFMVERDGSAKAIVFSQFISFLDLINYALGKCGVSCVQLVGTMSKAARDIAINKFREDPDCKIFLMSLQAGGVALNLTVASHVFMMDPCWNPAVERQAQDRIHRIGQYKPIRIVKFIIENTVEERILKLQKDKELLFDGSQGGIGTWTAEDIRFLFTT
ncbi:ATP-dependent helicase rhp16-like [Raphanus sativus]|uniref:ATP-dependent helicase rhp16-like n=1 Tax=Raphanus sativus TaxID=3726 RepID=A0A6J0P2N1_RAPSA|nr:ATP-dependent helicase rhp16-like [Raphanus sativus]XP_056860179.1 ATP-dependent helicase rhp16-like [Raphanus sativus]